MRRVEIHQRRHGTTYTVRFRHAGKQTSETFVELAPAETFAGILDVAGPADALAWLEAQDAAGPRSGPTFGEWFEQWVENLTGVQQRTRDDYRRIARHWFGPLDKLPLSILTRGHVAAIINDMERQGRKRHTIANAIGPLSSCLAAAVEEGLIPRNVAKGHRLPQAHDDEDDGEPTFLTHEEFAAVFDALPARLRPLVLLLVGTGLRWSEATALRVRDVDLEAKSLRVIRAWKRVKGGHEIGPPKTRKSRRTVTLPDEVVEALRPLVEGRGRDALVFVTPQSGKQLHHSNTYGRQWLPAVERSGIGKRPRIHDLRHTHASWLIRLGLPLPVIRDRLGHESITTTVNTYGHLMPDMQAEAARAAQLALSQTRPELA